MTELRDAIWNLYLAIHCTFDGTPSFKIIENGHGGAYIRQIIVHRLQLPVAEAPPTHPQKSSRKKKKRL
jgi:hypothetical protein